MIYWFLLILMAAAAVVYGTVKLKGSRPIGESSRDCLVFCIFGIAAFVIVFWKCLFQGMQLSYTNINYVFAPFSSLGVQTDGPLLSDVADSLLPNVWRVFCEHNYSLWDETVGLGASAQFEIFLYPLNYIYLLGLEYGQTVKYILEYLIGFLGMFFFLRSLKLAGTACYLGGITYTFCSVMVMWGGWPHSDVTAFGAWLFFLVERLLQCYAYEGRLKLKYGIGFIVVLWLMLVAGMPTYVPFFLYLGVVYTLYRGFQLFEKQQYVRRMLPILLLLGICVVIAALMSFLYTGTMLFSTQEYQEERSSGSFTTLAIEYARTIFFPYDREGLTMHANESTVYAGPMVGFVLSILLFFHKKPHGQTGAQLGFWHVTAWIVLLMVFTSGSGHLYQFFPMINSSIKIRVMVLFCFAGSVLTALICDGLARGTLYCKNKYKAAAALLGVPAVLAVIYGNIKENKAYYGFLGVIALLLLLLIWQNKKIYAYLLCGVVTLNMAGFAQAYMPLIAQGASAVPAPTDSVQYLQNELGKNHARFAALGSWNLFSQSNAYYNISQPASHGLNNTNSDLQNYFTSIDSGSYKSPTRVEFSNIENESLLSYASVEYLLSQAQSGLSVIDGMIADSNTKRNAVAYDGSSVLEQALPAENGTIRQLSILLSTYQKKLSDQDTLHISVIRKETGETLAKASVILGEVEDNQVRPVVLDRAVECTPGEHLAVRFEAERKFQLPLAIWVTDASIYEGELSIGGQPYSGDLCMYTGTNTDETFSDGESISHLGETSPRAFFASDILVEAGEEQVLDAMKAEYLPNTVFVTQEIAQENQIQEQQGSQVTGTVSDYESTGDHVSVRLTADGSGVMVLNDYYTDDWKAYVNGVETEVIRANYLFRGVVVPEAGEYEIEFVYQPTQTYLFAGVSLAGFIMLIALIILRKRLEAFINQREI